MGKDVKKTIAGQTRRLKESYETLKKAMPIIGETAGPGDGLSALAGKVKGAKVLTADMEAVVGSAGSIYPEDAVTIAKEPVKLGQAVRLATGGAKLLGAEAVTNTAVVVCFAQDGKTCLKAARLDEESKQWTLGPTSVLVEQELDKVKMVAWGFVNDYSCYTISVAVFYQEEDAGMVQFWDVDWSCAMFHAGTDIWTDQAPTNLCGAWTPILRRGEVSSGDKWVDSHPVQHNLITLAYMGSDGSFRLVGVVPQMHFDEESGDRYFSAQIWAEKSILPGEEHTGLTVMEPLGWTYKDSDTVGEPKAIGKHSDFTIAVPDGQEYASSAWCLTSGIGRGAMWLTYPGEDGERYALELWCVEDVATNVMVQHKYEPGACRRLVQKGYQACGAGSFLPLTHGYGQGPYFFGAIARLLGPNQRYSVGMECWSGDVENVFTPLVFGEEDKGYGGNIGLLRACWIDKDTVAVGYAVENKYRMFLVGGRGGNALEVPLLGGPTMEVTGVGNAAELVRYDGGVALACQRGMDIYLQKLGYAPVAVAVQNSRFAVAQAVTGGRPGQTIKLNRL